MKGVAAAFKAVRCYCIMVNKYVMKKLLTMLTCSALTVSLITAYSGRMKGSDVEATKTIAQIQEERKEKEAEIAALEEQIKALEGDKSEEKAYQDTLSDQIELIQENIKLLDDELVQINADITSTQENIQALNDDIAAQQVKIDENIELFKERLCAMYVTGNNSLTSAILGSTDFYDMLSRMEMLNCIAAHDEELVNEILDEISSIEASKSSLETEKLALEMKLDEQEIKRQQRMDEIEVLNDKYAKTQEEIERLELEKDKLNKSKEELEADIKLGEAQEKEILDQIAAEEKRKKEEADRLAQQQQQNSNNSSSGGSSQIYPTSPGASGFGWPVPGYYVISSKYGHRWGRLHAGIDIAGGGISGAPAVASKGGTVIGVKNSCSHNFAKTYNCCGNGYGNYVTVSHGDGYTTVYAHLSSINVSVGDYVSQGQQLGTVGCTGHSTGYHLHFEIRANGVAQNPSNYV